jgi:hypothetical protein
MTVQEEKRKHLVALVAEAVSLLARQKGAVSEEDLVGLVDGFIMKRGVTIIDAERVEDLPRDPPPAPIPDAADPPPGWTRYQITDEDGCQHESFLVRRKDGGVPLTVQGAWAQHNAARQVVHDRDLARADCLALVGALGLEPTVTVEAACKFAQTLRMQYLGAVQLLGSVGPHIRSTDSEGDDSLDLIAQALLDATELFPRYYVHKMLHRFELREK